MIVSFDTIKGSDKFAVKLSRVQDFYNLRLTARAIRGNAFTRYGTGLQAGAIIPPAVRQAEIPKGDGTKRVLGIPTVTDRVARMVIKQKLEKLADKHFSANSFGYRPNLSAHDAIKRCRINCLRYSCVIDLDIKGFFDNIDHDLMMLAVKRFTDEKCTLMCVERWLNANSTYIQQRPGKYTVITIRSGKYQLSWLTNHLTFRDTLLSPALSKLGGYCALGTWFSSVVSLFIRSRMNREVHVWFCERFGGETPPYLLDLYIYQSGSQFYF